MSISSKIPWIFLNNKRNLLTGIMCPRCLGGRLWSHQRRQCQRHTSRHGELEVLCPKNRCCFLGFFPINSRWKSDNVYLRFYIYISYNFPFWESIEWLSLPTVSRFERTFTIGDTKPGSKRCARILSLSNTFSILDEAFYSHRPEWTGQICPPVKTTSYRHPVHLFGVIGLNHCVPNGFLKS